MVELDPQVEQQLADLSDQDWRSLSARVRPPTSSEHLKNVASQVLSGSQLDTFMAIADPKKFADANGDIDEDRVMGHLTAIFGAAEPPRWGQTTGQPAGSGRAGDDARAALEKRHGVKRADTQPGSGDRITRGAGGRAALAKRHGGAK